MATHAITVLGATPTVLDTPTIIGAAQLMPAGGPWIIHNIWSQTCLDAPGAGDGFTADLLFNSVAGDITPDPAPGRYPIIGTSGTTGAVQPPTEVPLAIFDTNWTASGKAQFSLSMNLNLGISAAGQVAAGIIFGDTVPQPRPLTFVDSVHAQFLGGAEGPIGLITLSEKATRIVGLLGVLTKTAVVGAGDAIVGFFRLDSIDHKFPPAQYPFNNAFNGMAGAGVDMTTPLKPHFIPVDIPIKGGSNINCFVTTQGAVANGLDARVYIAYE